MAVKWEDPPGNEQTRYNSGYWWDVANELRTRPGEWAAVDLPSGGRVVSYPVHIRQAKRLAAFQPAGSFEAMTRQNTLWVRYVGENQEHA